MKTGFRGTFVIPWSQTEMDGQRSAPVSEISPGRIWSWTGEALRVDGPEGILPLGASKGDEELRKRAALTVRRLLSAVNANVTQPNFVALQEPLFRKHFILTDGLSTWDVSVVSTGSGRKPLLMFFGQIPPRNKDLWIVKHNLDQTTLCEADENPKGVICFTPGTLIETPWGPRDVASLAEGDKVQTKDNGPVEILWMGSKYVSGARMRAMPELVPVRLRAGALDKDVPDDGLLVSPDHRIILKGVKARVLFGADEVLVTARDLVNDHSIIRDHSAKSVRYIHMMLPHHEIVIANGVETESFHPANAALATMRPDEQDRLFDRLPEIQGDPSSYGGYARRLLNDSETAILRADH